VSGRHEAPATINPEKNPVSNWIGYSLGPRAALEYFGEQNKYFLTDIRNPGLSAFSLNAISTILSRLPQTTWWLIEDLININI